MALMGVEPTNTFIHIAFLILCYMMIRTYNMGIDVGCALILMNLDSMFWALGSMKCFLD